MKGGRKVPNLPKRIINMCTNLQRRGPLAAPADLADAAGVEARRGLLVWLVVERQCVSQHDQQRIAVIYDTYVERAAVKDATVERKRSSGGRGRGKVRVGARDGKLAEAELHIADLGRGGGLVRHQLVLLGSGAAEEGGGQGKRAESRAHHGVGVVGVGRKEAVLVWGVVHVCESVG